MKTIFILFAVAFLGGLGLFIFIIYKVIKAATKKRTPEENKKEKDELRQKINSQISNLSEWNGRSAKDLSCAIRYSYKKGISFKVSGTAYSSNNEPVLKYARIERGLNLAGHFYAATTDFNVYCIQNSNHYKYYMNEKFIGQILPSGKIFNAAKEEIGMAKHPINSSISSGFIRWRFGDTTFPVIIRGNHIANIKVAPDYSDAFTSDKVFSLVFNENQWGSSIVEELSTPNEEEELWLKLLAVTEVVYHTYLMPK